MKLKEKKTVRFAVLVEAAGQPEYATLWTKPEQDRDFTRAVKESRVVTLIQRNVGTRKDYGLIGFYPQENAGFLVFPRRIEQPPETKVVGIKYEMLSSSVAKGSRKARRRATERKKK